MDDSQEKLECDPQKYTLYQMKKNNQVFDNGPKFPVRLRDSGCHSDQSNISPDSVSATPYSTTSTGDEEEVLMAEGITAQLKRIGIHPKGEDKKYIEYLFNRIKDLEERLSSRNMVVSALQRELELLKEMTFVDASGTPGRLSSCPDSGDNIQQSSANHSQTEEHLYGKLKQKESEIAVLQDKLRVLSLTHDPVNAKFSNKVLVLESEVKEQNETIEELNLEIVQKSKLLCRVQDQLQKKSEEFGKQNMKTSLEIKQLMRSVDELTREVRNKDMELKQAKDELCNLRSELQINFGCQLANIKEQLKLCHDEEKDQLNLIHDDVMKQFMRAHETEVACYKKQIEALNHRVKEHSETEKELETELEACRLAHETQIVSYKECVESLMENISAEKEKNEVEYKRQIQKYKRELQSNKSELEHLQQQVDSFNDRLADEVIAVEKRCAEQFEQYRTKCEAQFIVYKSCAESLRRKDELATEEAASLEKKYRELVEELSKSLHLSKDEVNSINDKLKESQINEKSALDKLDDIRSQLGNVTEKYNSLTKLLEEKEGEKISIAAESEKLRNKLQEVEVSHESLLSELNKCRNALNEKESNEESLLNELNKCRSLIEEYDDQLKSCKKKFEEEMGRTEVRHESVVAAFQDQIDHLVSTLNEVKNSHEEDVNECAQQLMRQQQQLELLKQSTDTGSIEGICDKLKELKDCKIEIDCLNEKLVCASNSVCEYENRLAELHKCYENDILIYKTQIGKLKEELNSASMLEENLVRQLSNHVTDMKQSKEQIRDLLRRKDIQVYFLENERIQNDFVDDISSEKAINYSKLREVEMTVDPNEGSMSQELTVLYNKLDILSRENNLLKEEVDNLKKPKCNVSIQPHSNVEQKRHIEQALFDELEKELHDCKLDNSSKIKDIDELIKTNNNLVDHYSALQLQLEDMKEFATQKVKEINNLQSDKECLLYEKAQLEANQMVLIEKLESISEFQNKKGDVDSLPDENGDCTGNMFSENENILNMQKLFKHVATSTPNFDDNCSESETPKRKISDSKYKTNKLLSKWLNNCNILEAENAELKKDKELLKLQLHEMEGCCEEIRKEIINFEESCNSLKQRIAELETKKKVTKELEQINEQLKLRNEKLEEDRLVLRSEVAHLKDENLNLEKKYDETMSKLLSESNDILTNKGFNSLVLELTKKAEEVLLLKEEMALKQETITSLEDELDKFLEIRNCMEKKLESVVQDLKLAEEELLNMRQERHNIELEKRLAEKKLSIVRAQNEHLFKYFNEKTQKDCNNDAITIVEELEKELVELHKNLSAERGVIERMAVEKTTSKNSGFTDDSDASYKIELLLNAFEELQNEKELLKVKTIELQDIINKYADNNEVDEEWKLEVKESQKKLLEELEMYRQHHDVLGKSLIETEDLKAKVEFAEKELLMKIQEKAKVEDLLAAERQGLCSALKRIKYLEKQLSDKMSVLQVMDQEKEGLQGNLWSLQEKLCGLEEHLQQQKLILEGEIQERELRVRHAQLELHAAQLDKNAVINKLILEAETETEMERVSQLKEELEKEHDLAISRLKRLYSSQLHEVIEQAASQQLDIEQRHHEQVLPYCDG